MKLLLLFSGLWTILPLATATAATIDPIFFDSYETGDACGWSATKPPTFCGECAAGEALIHESGVLGIADPDTFEPPFVDWSEYRCAPAQTCKPSSCAEGHTCLDTGGRVACACKPGYAGARCERCAVGYQMTKDGCVLGGECRTRFCSGQGECVDRAGELSCRCDVGATGEFCQHGGKTGGPLRPPTRIEVSGAETSIEQGEEVALRAKVFGDAVDTRLVWQLVEGPGTVDPPLGPAVTYTAPAPDGTKGLQTALLHVSAECCPGEVVPVALTIVPPGGITISGTTKKELAPLDQAVIDFMLHRCIGAATLGVALYGKVIHTRGFGNLSGAPSSDLEYLETCGDTFDVSGAVPGIILPAPAPVQPNTPLRIGSNTKALTAAIARRAIRGRITEELGDPSPTDDDVEAALLTDAALDLLPASLRDVMSGASPPPIPHATSSGGTVDCSSDNPCPYGGFCYQPQGAAGVCIGCPAGQSGVDCSLDLDFCPDLSSQADSRWAGVTVGHVLKHQTGMPKSTPSAFGIGYPNLGLLRDLTNAVDWNLQEALLTTETGFPAGDFQSEFNALPGTRFDAAKTDVGLSRFVPRIGDRDQILSRLGSCLLFSPGSDSKYTNTGFALLGLLAEHTTGQLFAAQEGKPGEHVGSLLEAFLTDELGLPLPGQGTQEGIFFSQNNLARRSLAEPIYREWNDNQSTYYPLAWDSKRPYCVPDGGDCSFLDWLENDSAKRVRYPWHFDFDGGSNRPERTLTTMAGNEIDGSGGAGGLAAEPAVYLKFMSKFWVKGKKGEAVVGYGKTRCPGGDCIWNLHVRHNGARAGTKSWVMQLGAGSPAEVTEYKIPPVDPMTGRILDDFGDLETHECVLPAGVDLFFAMNTTNDKKCEEAEAAGDYTCKGAYKRLPDFLLHGICEVAWPANPFVVWPQQLTTPAPPPVP